MEAVLVGIVKLFLALIAAVLVMAFIVICVIAAFLIAAKICEIATGEKLPDFCDKVLGELRRKRRKKW